MIFLVSLCFPIKKSPFNFKRNSGVEYGFNSGQAFDVKSQKKLWLRSSSILIETSFNLLIRKKLGRIGINSSATNYNCLCKGGYGYLKTKIKAFNKAANVLPFLVLTDQDNGCPPDKIKGWLNHKANSNLIFRIAVMKIESWVMADRKTFAKFLSIPLAKFPDKMDEIKDPKQLLLSIVKNSCSRSLIEDIVPRPGSTAKIGPNYNARLSDFVRNSWDVYEAIKCSESLYRAFQRIQEVRQVHKE